MSSALPNPDNGYQWPPAPARADLDRAAWNAVFATVAARFAALEHVSTGIEQLQIELQNFGVDRLNAAINPLIETTTATLEELVTQQSALQVLVDSLLFEIVPADAVTQSATRVFVTPAQKAEIGTLRADVTELVADLATEVAARAAIKFGTIRPFVASSVSVTAAAGQRIRVDSSAGVVTVTLPAAPVNGDVIDVLRIGTNAVIVARNGKTIVGQAEDLTIDENKRLVSLTYSGGDWRVAGSIIA